MAFYATTFPEQRLEPIRGLGRTTQCQVAHDVWTHRDAGVLPADAGSNQDGPQAPLPVQGVPQGTPTVSEVDGSIGTGALHLIRVKLRPMEVQILRRVSQP